MWNVSGTLESFCPNAVPARTHLHILRWRQAVQSGMSRESVGVTHRGLEAFAPYFLKNLTLKSMHCGSPSSFCNMTIHTVYQLRYTWLSLKGVTWISCQAVHKSYWWLWRQLGGSNPHHPPVHGFATSYMSDNGNRTRLYRLNHSTKNKQKSNCVKNRPCTDTI